MSARYRVEHRSRYHYGNPVTASFNEVRLTPAATAWQHPLESAVQVGQASWQHRYVDYWGTQVRVLEISEPHSELVIDASSLVEVDPSRRPGGDPSLGWGEVRSDAVADRFGEYLTQSDSTEPPAELAALAESTAADQPPNATARAISEIVHDAMTYRPGSTGVHTLASEAWANRNGVCQDYAHLVVGALRHAGLPARYVSGYLHPKSEPEVGEPAVGESHAWVEWWLGEWLAYDPTNAAEVAARHVMIGTGRDYGDVPPIKGIVAGSPATTDLSVEVIVTRLA